MRILTGIVNITSDGPKSGTVRIRFNPHEKLDGDVSVVERGTIGPAGRFVAVPAKHVALRQITFIDLDSAKNRFSVGDEITRDRLRITWSGTGASFSEEISYLVIGEVPDSRARAKARSRPRAARRRSAR
ncbi:MAG TPA: hypothetical protein VML54_17405 [Candidatus Limnocylindrales bacterium]|nr:hypothetical protein [Candidatus Limnocylindrales bacterium]